jgi:transcriptional/translational regulatory protein YebC/TACO1
MVESAETARKIMRLMDVIDELDDVVATHSNFDIADGVSIE